MEKCDQGLHMCEKNQHDLPRDIPDVTKRTIRQQCGFGCVMCGNAIVQYEHVEPEFKDAKTHDPTNMTLLCGSCHYKVTKKLLSKDTLKKAMANPFCVRSGKCNDSFDIGNESIVIWFATNRFKKPGDILKVKNETLLTINTPEQPNGPFRISGKFYNTNGVLSLRIIDNEWFGEISNWDIDCIGRRIIIRQKSHKISLQIAALPPTGIVIEKINMVFSNLSIFGTLKKLTLTKQANSASGKVISNFKEQDITCNGINVTNEGFNLEGPVSIGKLPDGIRQPFFPISSTKPSRNDSCPCKSGLKYKKCCLEFDE